MVIKRALGVMPQGYGSIPEVVKGLINCKGPITGYERYTVTVEESIHELGSLSKRPKSDWIVYKPRLEELTRRCLPN